MMRKVALKIYRGNIDLRSYDVETAVKNNENIKVVHNGLTMTLTPDDLTNKCVFLSKEFQSKVGGKNYRLHSYQWNPDM